MCMSSARRVISLIGGLKRRTSRPAVLLSEPSSQEGKVNHPVWILSTLRRGPTSTHAPKTICRNRDALFKAHKILADSVPVEAGRQPV